MQLRLGSSESPGSGLGKDRQELLLPAHLDLPPSFTFSSLIPSFSLPGAYHASRIVTAPSKMLRMQGEASKPQILIKHICNMCISGFIYCIY